MARCTVEAEDSEVESSCSSINQNSVSKKKITRPMPTKMPLRKMHRKQDENWSAVLPKFRTSCPRFKGPLARKRATIRADGALHPTAWNKVATWTLNLTPSYQNMLFVQQTETWTLTVSQNKYKKHQTFHGEHQNDSFHNISCTDEIKTELKTFQSSSKFVWHKWFQHHKHSTKPVAKASIT